VSLAMLTDEEVILLAQNGKIALHALEKVLDGGAKDNVNLERAVRIRRALFCEFLLIYLGSQLLTMMTR
jgi:hydroxymethylglutaryl-CoA reductase (NADPH)